MASLSPFESSVSWSLFSSGLAGVMAETRATIALSDVRPVAASPCFRANSFCASDLSIGPSPSLRVNGLLVCSTSPMLLPIEARSPDLTLSATTLPRALLALAATGSAPGLGQPILLHLLRPLGQRRGFRRRHAAGLQDRVGR